MRNYTTTTGGRNHDTNATRLYRLTGHEYAYDADVFCPDDSRVSLAKWVVDNRLTEPERIMIRLYAEYASLREMGRDLGIKRSTLHDEIKRIRTKIITEMKQRGYDNAD